MVAPLLDLRAGLAGDELPAAEGACGIPGRGPLDAVPFLLFIFFRYFFTFTLFLMINPPMLGSLFQP